jgi:CRISPR/Cas system-associated exonuclease Cas4 (RecB family)
MESNNLQSGSICKIASLILSNPPYDRDAHHAQREIGHAHLAGKCSRQIWFKTHIMKEDQPSPAPVMVMGKAIHDWFDSAIEQLGEKTQIMVKQFVDFRPRYNVIGRADFVSPNSVGELKTSKAYAFKYLDAPQDDHLLQSSIYAHYFQRRYIEIIYLARDTGQFKTFFWPALRGIEAEIERISYISTAHNPPEKVTWDGKPLEPWTAIDENGHAKTPWQCKYCPFRMECLDLDNTLGLKISIDNIRG